MREERLWIILNHYNLSFILYFFIKDVFKISKGRHNITIDNYIWDLARDELDVSISEFVENQLRTYLDEDDELSVLMKEEANLQNKLNSIQAKICTLRERKHDEKVRKKEFDDAMESINSIYNELGYVGKNQIKFIAKKNDLSHLELREHCRDEGIEVTNFGEIPKK